MCTYRTSGRSSVKRLDLTRQGLALTPQTFDLRPRLLAKVVGDREGAAAKAAEPYVQTVLREIAATRQALGDSQVPRGGLKTVFFGGGTPSLCPPHLVRQLLEALERDYGLAADAEICAEMDPGTFDKELLNRFLDLGLTRISM